MRNWIWMLVVCLSAFQAVAATYVDDQGVMRWSESKKEVCVFGTNYAPPFAYWEARAPIGADPYKAIDEDVYHIARLGIDGYRVHVWPGYISDDDGNLVYNEHFALFDYLLFKLKERGIKLFITPMYLSGTNGGFPKKFGGKVGCLVNPEAFPAQANYLAQFVSHVNPYTGIAYMDDPDLLGFEIVNEPQHYKRPDLVTGYINQMVDAIRATGCTAPLFYNMTTCAAHIDEVLKAKIDGGTFQWYPTGLTANHDLKGNLLPNTDHYTIPFDDKLEGRLSKFVYEFSPADVGASAVMYPAMARSFREAGFQFAAYFAYDPMHAAYCNVAYRTHFMNLAYTPKKAIGLMIASEAFHDVSRKQDCGRFPQNNRFEDIDLSYEQNRAERVTQKTFLYSNDTQTSPSNPERLEKIAGTGNSPLVQYDGTGAYMLDKLEAGVWRLEVMPDAVWVHDPFFVPYIQRETAVTVWRNRFMKLAVPDLGGRFDVRGLNDGNTVSNTVESGAFSVEPGSYLLVREGVATEWSAEDRWKNIQLKEFHAPARGLQKDYLLHTPPAEVSVQHPLCVSARVITEAEPDAVELIVLGVGQNGYTVPMTKVRGFEYEAMLPEELLKQPGLIRYHIAIKQGDQWKTFPSATVGDHPKRRRIYGDDRLIDDAAPYVVRVVENCAPVCLFDAQRDWADLTKAHRKHRFDCYPAEIPGKTLIHLTVQNKKNTESDFSVRAYCEPYLQDRIESLGDKTALSLYGHGLNGKACTLQLALLMKNGVGYGARLKIQPEAGTYTLPLSELKRVKSVLLPRAYPSFHSYWFESAESAELDLSQVESLQISIRPDSEDGELDASAGVAIGWIRLR